MVCKAPFLGQFVPHGKTLLGGDMAIKRLDFARIIVVLALASAVGSTAFAGPPLPNHSLEGTGGIFTTHCAYLVNPAEEGEMFGKPAVGGFFLYLGKGRNLSAFTVTQTLWDRVELGYGFNRLDLENVCVSSYYEEPYPEGDGNAANKLAANGMSVGIRDDGVEMHNFNLRLNLVKEGDLLEHMPAVTAGVHYKYNDDYDDMNRDLGHALSSSLGIKKKQSWDITLYATKLVTCLPRNVLLNAGVRSTEAAHIGLLGFTDNRKIVMEGSAGVFVLDNLVLGGEFRQKPAEYNNLSGVVEDEDDWWTLFADYIINDNLSATVAYGNLGHILNHTASHAYGVQLKYEF